MTYIHLVFPDEPGVSWEGDTAPEEYTTDRGIYQLVRVGNPVGTIDDATGFKFDRNRFAWYEPKPTV
ncbi:hypothetical protein CLV49_3288 [Labedella gwakjiensis]|uniref:Uncharacterized protein n=1 Tax=Labedella gwakjiensis TaxID=390269 RepID=A0A2P8H091_9MICO|nr:hypothetical protein [Labedella gwakjiensis]PSL39644.1 hypothetical protein CLV49_3288 [Labedella gwakjiensis]RUQ85966.1 hypothetical protein ELQ93_02815 [Labedella gwakjiensis]